jgi:hypothetical protein
VNPGQKVTLTAVLTNDTGSNTNMTNVVVRFYNADPRTTGNQFGPDQLINLPVGKSDTVTTSVTIPDSSTAGVLQYFVYVDATVIYAEWNVDDNVAGTRVVINVPPPQINVSRSCLNFATANPGDSVRLSLRICNTGVGALLIDSAVFSNADYSMFLTPLNLDSTTGRPMIPSGNCATMWVTFKPTVRGLDNGSLTIYSNDSGHSIVIVSLTGQGTLLATGNGQQIFAGFATIDGGRAPGGTVVGAYRTNGELITSYLIPNNVGAPSPATTSSVKKAAVQKTAPTKTAPVSLRDVQGLFLKKVQSDSITGPVNYALSVLVGQDSIAAGDTIIFKVITLECGVLGERYCEPWRMEIFNPAFPPVGGFTQYNVDAVDAQSLTIPVDTGYNAISWNVVPSNMAVTSIFSNLLAEHKVKIILDYVNNYNPLLGDTASSPQFEWYIPQLGRYNPFQLTNFKKGYFLRVPAEVSSDSVVVTGTPVCDSVPIPLDSGYNFVSYIPLHQDTITSALASLKPNNLETALSWNNTANDFWFYPNGGLTSMSEGNGYFLQVAAPDVLRYPEIDGAPSVPAAQTAHGKIMAAAKTQSIVKGKKRTMSTGTAFPQAVFAYGLTMKINGKLVPKGTEIKAVDRNGVVCGTSKFADDGVFSMAIRGDNPATTVEEGPKPGEMVKIYVGGQLLAQQVKWTEFGDTPLLDGTQAVLSVTPTLGLPKVFALHQNYPNPFNPTTTIQYDLPKTAKVSLTVYDMLGQEVRTLVAGDQQAGVYHQTWDGKNNEGRTVASGVYLYRISAASAGTNFVAVHKMIYLK